MREKGAFTHCFLFTYSHIAPSNAFPTVFDVTTSTIMELVLSPFPSYLLSDSAFKD